MLQTRRRTQPSGVRATHSLLAQLYARLEQPEKADIEARSAAALPLASSWPDPYQQAVNNTWVGLRAGLIHAVQLWNQGSRRIAVDFLRSLVNEYPNSDRAQFSLGDRLNRLGEFAEAEGPLRKATIIDPSFARAHFELGYSVHQQGKASEAVKHYREAVRLQPDFAVAYFDLSFALNSLGDRAAAIEALRNAIQHDPGMAPAYQQLGELLRQDGKHAKSRAALLRAAELAKEPSPAGLNLGQSPADEPGNK